MRLVVRHNNTYASVRCLCEVDGSGNLVVPHTRMVFHVLATINGRPTQPVAATIAASPLWELLMYHVDTEAAEEPTRRELAEEMTKSEDTNTSTQNSFNLRCRIFGAIAGDLRDVPLLHLRLVIVNICFYSADNFDVNSLLRYLGSSLMLHLEYKYPYVFSVYGRHFFHLNYPWLTRMIRRLGVKDVARALEVNLVKLERRILSEFNTLNIMVEMTRDLKKLRRAQAQKHPSPKTSVKAHVFSLAW